MKITVVGGASAPNRPLRCAGFEVEVYEQAPELTQIMAASIWGRMQQAHPATSGPSLPGSTARASGPFHPPATLAGRAHIAARRSIRSAKSLTVRRISPFTAPDLWSSRPVFRPSTFILVIASKAQKMTVEAWFDNAFGLRPTSYRHRR